MRDLTSPDKFDEHFFVIRDYFGHTRIGWEEATINPRTKRKFVQLKTKKKADFFEAYIDKRDAGEKALAPRWFAKTEKRYSKVVYKDPKLVLPDELNLYHGFSVEPIAGDVTPYTEFVEEIVCNGDKAVAEYLHNLFGRAVQFPFEPWGIYVICYSEKEGTGKDTLQNMFGDLFMDSFSTKNFERVFGSFNSQIAWKPVVLFTDVDTISAQGMAKARADITSPRIDIEKKGLEGGNIDNIMKLVRSTNSDACAKVSLTDRRTLALAFSDKRIGDKAYWDRLYKWYYEEGGINNVLSFLKERKLGDFKPYPRPITKLLQRMQDKSLPDEAKAMLDMLEYGYLPEIHWTIVRKNRVKVRRLSTKDFREYYQDRYPGIQRISDNLISDLFKGIGCTRKKTESGNVWVLPPLEDCRRAWDQKRNSNRDWDASAESWWDREDVDVEGNINKKKDATAPPIGDNQSAKLDDGAALVEGSERQQQNGSTASKSEKHDTQESSDTANWKNREVEF